jgi:hypothetical protein
VSGVGLGLVPPLGYGSAMFHPPVLVSASPRFVPVTAMAEGHRIGPVRRLLVV